MADVSLFNALGCAVRIDTSGLSAGDAQHIEHAWSGARCAAGDPIPAAHLTVPVRPQSSLRNTLSSLSQQVTLAAIRARRGRLWMLHATGVADPAGRVVALIGPSGQGKTTAAAALSRHYGYVSDETVGIDPRGAVLPYRKPLSVIEDADSAKVQRSPEELGLLPLPQAPLRLAALVLLDRRADGPDEPVLEACDLGEALEHLVGQTSYLADVPAPLRMIAAHAAATGGVRRIVYREAETLASAIAPLFQEPSPPVVEESAIDARQTSGAPGIYRGPYLDALPLEDPDRIALLQPNATGPAYYRLVAGIGPALWRAAAGSTPTDLHDAAVRSYGAPEGVDVAAAVETAIRALTDDGVLADEPTWRIRPDVATTGHDDRFLALALSDLLHPTPVALEGSAAVIWSLLASARAVTATELLEAIAAQTGATPDQIDDDVRSFLDMLEAGSLAERIAP